MFTDVNQQLNINVISIVIYNIFKNSVILVLKLLSQHTHDYCPSHIHMCRSVYIFDNTNKLFQYLY